MEAFLFAAFFYLLGLAILYMVIEAAVKNGINKSILAKFVEKKHGLNPEKTSFLDKDLDNDK